MSTGAFGICLTAGGLNAIANYRQNKPVTGGLFASAVLGLMCNGIDEGSKTQVGTAFALLFLLTSFLLNGTLFVGLVTAMTNDASFTPAPSAPSPRPGQPVNYSA